MVRVRMSVELEGAEELRRRLGKSQTYAKVRLNEALRGAGRIYLPTLKAETPVRTGRLRRSSVFTVGGPQAQALLVRQAAKTKAGLFYGAFVRFGTRRMRANPYHARAWAKVAGQVMAVLKATGRRFVMDLGGR